MKRHRIIRLGTVGLAMITAGAMLASCHKDDSASGVPQTCGAAIGFGISTRDGWPDEASAERRDAVPARDFILRGTDPADSLCMRATVIDGIAPSARTAVTRGAQVTDAASVESFHVFAYYGKGSESGILMNNVETMKSGDVWATDQQYYWPGSDFTLDFHALSPYGAEGVAFTPVENGSAPVFDYAVPADVTAQSDLMVASAPEVDGNYNKAVLLAFDHICTAVQFKAGSSMAAGTIKSITLNNILGKATFDMAAREWKTDGSSLGNFSLKEEQITTATVSGAAITGGENTLMMLPQTLGPDASIEVVFADANGGERTLTALISGEWPMGKTVVYSLSITPSYEIKITVPEAEQDAHYIWFPITVGVSDLNGDWSLTSNYPNDVFFCKEQTDLQKQGYWIDEDKGQSTVEETGNGTFTYYVYVSENIGDAPRNLQFRITTNIDKATATTATVQQLCPSWNAQGIGYERIEENNGGNYPFGFKWDRKVVYSYEGFWAFLFKWAADAYKNTDTESYLSTTWNITSVFPPKSLTTVTIDYKNIGNSLNVGMDTENGLSNTRRLYFFKDIGAVSEMETILDAITIGSGKWDSKITEGGDYQSVQNFAVKMAVMKNKFSKEERTESNNGETLTYYVPVIAEQDINWYLPASSEQSSLSDTEYPLNNTYWSSTAANDNINAISYDASSATTRIDRMTSNKIRAVRQKP